MQTNSATTATAVTLNRAILGAWGPGRTSRAAAHLHSALLVYSGRAQEGDLVIRYAQGLCMQIDETWPLEVIADDRELGWVVTCSQMHGSQIA